VCKLDAVFTMWLILEKMTYSVLEKWKCGLGRIEKITWVDKIRVGKFPPAPV